MAVKRQKRKHNLTVQRPIVTVDRLNVSLLIEGFQALTPFLFLILKSLIQLTPPPRNAIERRRRRVLVSLAFAPKNSFSCGQFSER
jgi:hypothetical protein